MKSGLRLLPFPPPHPGTPSSPSSPMRPPVLVRVLAVVLLSLSCNDLPADPWTAELPDGSVQVLVDSVRNEQFTRETTGLPLRNEYVYPERFEVRDQAAWELFWTRMRTDKTLPYVDFDTEMVIVVALGRVVPPWDRVFIAGVMANGAQLYVLVFRDGINPSCQTRSRPYTFEEAPVALALVPRLPGTPKYLERLAPLPRCY